MSPYRTNIVIFLAVYFASVVALFVVVPESLLFAAIGGAWYCAGLTWLARVLNRRTQAAQEAQESSMIEAFLIERGIPRAQA